MNTRTIIVSFASFFDCSMDFLKEVRHNVRNNGWLITDAKVANTNTGLEIHLEGQNNWQMCPK